MGASRPAPVVAVRRGLVAWILGAALGLSILGAHAEDEPVPAPPRGGLAEAGATAHDLAVAKAARPSVARVRLRDRRFGDLTMTRHAVVVRRDGLFVMAGPPPGRTATLTLVLADGRELRARQLGYDAETALTLLRVATTGLVPLPGGAPSTRAAGPAQPSRPAQGKPVPGKPVPGKAAPGKVPAGRVPAGKVAPNALANTPRGLRSVPLGTRLVMVTGDAAMAVGTVRAQGRVATLRDPDRRRAVPTTGLLGVALAAVDTDAGAPLLDARGRLAGLLVGRKAVLAPERGEQAARQGLTLRPTPVEALAVPGDVVRLIWPLLERHGRVPRAGLGIDTETVAESLRQHLGLSAGGHLIRRVTPGGPAARQGLRRHDVIVSVGGRPVATGTRLHDLLLPYRPRATVVLGLVRAGEPVEVTLVLGERTPR